MPIYSYKCSKCQSKFDKLVPSFKVGEDVGRIQCPECGTVGEAERVWHTVGAPVFKGSGFYKTDYSGKTVTNATKESTPEPP